MSKRRSIQQLVTNNKKRVYLFLADLETQTRFLTDAEAEGYTFRDGAKLSERKSSDFYALNPNKTVNYINSIGKMAVQCHAKNIVGVDYKKYVSGDKAYRYR